MGFTDMPVRDIGDLLPALAYQQALERLIGSARIAAPEVRDQATLSRAGRATGGVRCLSMRAKAPSMSSMNTRALCEEAQHDH